MTNDHRPNPIRRDPPRMAPVLFEDDFEDEPERRGGGAGGGRGGGGGDGRGGRGGRGRRPEGFESDAGLLRILVVVAVLGVMILALVLPWSPLRVIGGGGSDGDGTPGPDGVTAVVREDVPPIPAGLERMSRVYEIRVPEGATGPWGIDVTLERPARGSEDLAYYSYQDGRWLRIAPVALDVSGRVVTGDIASPPGTIAVLQRVAPVRSLGLIVGAGQTPDPAALAGSPVVAVMAATAGTDGTISASAGALEEARRAAPSAAVFLGISGQGADGLVTALATPAGREAHIEAVAVAAASEDAAGVFLDYGPLPASQRDPLTGLVRALRDRLQRDQRALVIAVTASGGEGYDWAALADASDGLWLRVGADPAAYYPELEAALEARRAAGVDMERVSLVVDRRSQAISGSQRSAISLRDALTEASTIDRRIESGVVAGAPLTLRALHLGESVGDEGLRWDERARAVTYTYADAGGLRTIWLENRYSMAFRLDLASRYGLGGVVVEAAQQDEALPDVWEPVSTFVLDGSAPLMRPYGPYLSPCWQPSAGSVEGAPECWTAEDAPAVVVWRAPQAPGIYDVQLVVSDGTVFVAQQIAFSVTGTGGRVEPTPEPTPEPAPEPAPAAEPDPAPTPEPAAEPDPTPTPEPEPTATPEPAATPEPSPTPPASDFPAGVPPGPAGE